MRRQLKDARVLEGIVQYCLLNGREYKSDIGSISGLCETVTSLEQNPSYGGMTVIDSLWVEVEVCSVY